ncbi:hypothetical protein C8F01DRAFT_1079976 [Mycena amicta]|nr:hypothetical protein C8F01DRAFT_1079976 [Mycena amicta]
MNKCSFLVVALFVPSILGDASSVHTDNHAFTCHQYNINWNGGYSLRDTAAPDPPLVSQTQTANGFVWIPNVPANTEVSLQINDSAGTLDYTGTFVIQEGQDTSCIDPRTTALMNAAPSETVSSVPKFSTSLQTTAQSSSDAALPKKSTFSASASSTISTTSTTGSASESSTISTTSTAGSASESSTISSTPTTGSASESPSSSGQYSYANRYSSSNTTTKKNNTLAIVTIVVPTVCALGIVLVLLFLFLLLRRRRRVKNPLKGTFAVPLRIVPRSLTWLLDPENMNRRPDSRTIHPFRLTTTAARPQKALGVRFPGPAPPVETQGNSPEPNMSNTSSSQGSAANGRIAELQRQVEDLIADNARLSAGQPPDYDSRLGPSAF